MSGLCGTVRTAQCGAVYAVPQKVVGLSIWTKIITTAVTEAAEVYIKFRGGSCRVQRGLLYSTAYALHVHRFVSKCWRRIQHK